MEKSPGRVESPVRLLASPAPYCGQPYSRQSHLPSSSSSFSLSSPQPPSRCLVPAKPASAEVSGQKSEVSCMRSAIRAHPRNSRSTSSLRIRVNWRELAVTLRLPATALHSFRSPHPVFVSFCSPLPLCVSSRPSRLCAKNLPASHSCLFVLIRGSSSLL